MSGAEMNREGDEAFVRQAKAVLDAGNAKLDARVRSRLTQARYAALAQAGARRFITFHFLVPDSWPVARAHQLSEEIESRMRSLVPNAAVFTHIEPISDPASYDDQGLDR